MGIEVHQDRVKIKKGNSLAANINLMVQLEKRLETAKCYILKLGKKPIFNGVGKDGSLQHKVCLIFIEEQKWHNLLSLGNVGW